MRTLLGYCLLSACLTLGLQAADSASSENVKVQASSDLRVAILDTTRAGQDRSAVYDAFAASLGTAMTRHCGGVVTVKITEVDAVRLSFDLKARVYDAAFVVGENVPSVLKRGNFEIIRATSEASSGRVFNMIVPNEDPSLQRMIANSFPEALSGAKFQQAWSRSLAIRVDSDAVRKAVKESVADTTR